MYGTKHPYTNSRLLRLNECGYMHFIFMREASISNFAKHAIEILRDQPVMYLQNPTEFRDCCHGIRVSPANHLIDVFLRCNSVEFFRLAPPNSGASNISENRIRCVSEGDRKVSEYIYIYIYFEYCRIGNCFAGMFTPP